VVLWIEEFTAETLRALRDAEEEGGKAEIGKVES
jgi:hypothetical protein